MGKMLRRIWGKVKSTTTMTMRMRLRRLRKVPGALHLHSWWPDGMLMIKAESVLHLWTLLYLRGLILDTILKQKQTLPTMFACHRMRKLQELPSKLLTFQNQSNYNHSHTDTLVECWGNVWWCGRDREEKEEWVKKEVEQRGVLRGSGNPWQMCASSHNPRRLMLHLFFCPFRFRMNGHIYRVLCQMWAPVLHRLRLKLPLPLERNLSYRYRSLALSSPHR